MAVWRYLSAAAWLGVLTCQARASTGEFGYFILGVLLPAGLAATVALGYFIASKAPWHRKVLVILVAITAEVLFFILKSSRAIPFGYTAPLIALIPVACLFIADRLLRRQCN
jgi:hypothetical protein